MGLGFVATGRGAGQLGNPFTIFNDSWEYDAATNHWFGLPNIGGGGRYSAAGFAIGSTLYIAAGTWDEWTPSAMKKDFWSLTFTSN